MILDKLHYKSFQKLKWCFLGVTFCFSFSVFSSVSVNVPNMCANIFKEKLGTSVYNSDLLGYSIVEGGCKQDFLDFAQVAIQNLTATIQSGEYKNYLDNCENGVKCHDFLRPTQEKSLYWYCAFLAPLYSSENLSNDTQSEMKGYSQDLKQMFFNETEKLSNAKLKKNVGFMLAKIEEEFANHHHFDALRKKQMFARMYLSPGYRSYRFSDYQHSQDDFFEKANDINTMYFNEYKDRLVLNPNSNYHKVINTNENNQQEIIIDNVNQNIELYATSLFQSAAKNQLKRVIKERLAYDLRRMPRNKLIQIKNSWDRFNRWARQVVCYQSGEKAQSICEQDHMQVSLEIGIVYAFEDLEQCDLDNSLTEYEAQSYTEEEKKCTLILDNATDEKEWAYTEQDVYAIEQFISSLNQKCWMNRGSNSKYRNSSNFHYEVLDPFFAFFKQRKWYFLFGQDQFLSSIYYSNNSEELKNRCVNMGYIFAKPQDTLWSENFSHPLKMYLKSSDVPKVHWAMKLLEERKVFSLNEIENTYFSTLIQMFDDLKSDFEIINGGRYYELSERLDDYVLIYPLALVDALIGENLFDDDSVIASAEMGYYVSEILLDKQYKRDVFYRTAQNIALVGSGVLVAIFTRGVGSHALFTKISALFVVGSLETMLFINAKDRYHQAVQNSRKSFIANHKNAVDSHAVYAEYKGMFLDAKISLALALMFDGAALLRVIQDLKPYAQHIHELIFNPAYRDFKRNAFVTLQALIKRNQNVEAVLDINTITILSDPKLYDGDFFRFRKMYHELKDIPEDQFEARARQIIQKHSGIDINSIRRDPLRRIVGEADLRVNQFFSHDIRYFSHRVRNKLLDYVLTLPVNSRNGWFIEKLIYFSDDAVELEKMLNFINQLYRQGRINIQSLHRKIIEYERRNAFDYKIVFRDNVLKIDPVRKQQLSRFKRILDNTASQSSDKEKFLEWVERYVPTYNLDKIIVKMEQEHLTLRTSFDFKVFQRAYGDTITNSNTMILRRFNLAWPNEATLNPFIQRSWSRTGRLQNQLRSIDLDFMDYYKLEQEVKRIEQGLFTHFTGNSSQPLDFSTIVSDNIIERVVPNIRNARKAKQILAKRRKDLKVAWKQYSKARNYPDHVTGKMLTHHEALERSKSIANARRQIVEQCQFPTNINKMYKAHFSSLAMFASLAGKTTAYSVVHWDDKVDSGRYWTRLFLDLFIYSLVKKAKLANFSSAGKSMLLVPLYDYSLSMGVRLGVDAGLYSLLDNHYWNNEEIQLQNIQTYINGNSFEEIEGQLREMIQYNASKTDIHSSNLLEQIDYQISQLEQQNNHENILFSQEDLRFWESISDSALEEKLLDAYAMFIHRQNEGSTVFKNVDPSYAPTLKRFIFYTGFDLADSFKSVFLNHLMLYNFCVNRMSPNFSQAFLASMIYTEKVVVSSAEFELRKRYVESDMQEQ
ncbi:hypothetical protein MRY82_02100 [bacterium]|nr:hypothetical protein [bacterium]